jgi:hypothetical protein
MAVGDSLQVAAAALGNGIAAKGAAMTASQSDGGTGEKPGAASQAQARAVTALILTFNEEKNIARTLVGLDWVDHILVVDSGSTDATLAILKRTPGVEVLGRPFDCFENQRNFGLERIRTPGF